MAINKGNALLKGFVGKIAGMVLKELPNGEQYAAKLPGKRTTEMPATQKKETDDFTLAVRYAQGVISCPEATAFYRQHMKNGSVFHAAISDYRKKPRISEVRIYEHPELLRLYVAVEGTVGVAETRATYEDKQGKGHSLLPNVLNESYQFELRKENIASAVTIIAKDRPGNETSYVMENW